MNNKLTSYLLVAPALTIVILLCGGGVLLALLQSFNYMPLIGPNDFSLTARPEAMGMSMIIAIIITLLILFYQRIINNQHVNNQ